MSTTSPRLLARIAWRNLGRNRRRTGLTGAAIVLGVALCIAMTGLNDGLSADMVASVTEIDLGDVQVHREGFLDRRSLELTLPDGVALARRVEQEPSVTAAAARVYAWGFATRGDRTLGVELMGVEPSHEARVTRLARDITRGAQLVDEPTPWPSASPLSDPQRALDAKLTERARDEAMAEIAALGEPESHDPQGHADMGEGAGVTPPAVAVDSAREREAARALLRQQAPRPSAALPVLLGDGLARRLHADVGTDLTLLAQDSHGASVDVDAHVVGLLHTGDSRIDRGRVVLQLTDLERLLALGGGVHEIAARVGDHHAAREVARRLRTEAPFAASAVQSWDELRPDLVAMIGVDDALMGLILGVVFVLAGLGVVSSMLMAVFERRREFGVLRALGLEPGALLLMVALETMVLSVASAALGVVLGAAIDLYLAHHGLDVRSVGRFSLAGVGIEPVLHAAITPRGLLAPVVVMTVVAALGSLFPAVLAARVAPAVGMREA